MTSEDFKHLASVDQLNLPLQALWHDEAGDWSRAHEVCQKGDNRDGDWVHAYLHRKEGDIANARYWYSRAGRPAPSIGTPLTEEWSAIAEALLASCKT